MNLNSTLRKLPGLLTHSFCPEHLAAAIGNNYTNIGSVTICIYQLGKPDLNVKGELLCLNLAHWAITCGITLPRSQVSG